ncbi:hypothetical protein PybrP1_000856 [[Pythium] brassicae (nom. inval.)]|nr:hypothetical protein PybrP1_000856 [[Pythium] brassicae (nom. inval.)]
MTEAPRSTDQERLNEYSVERMLAFRQYSERTSTLRVGLVLILSLSPAFLTLFLIDVIPLQDPSRGWRANSSFWIRLFMTAIVAAASCTGHAQVLVPALQLSLKRTAIIVIGTAIGYTGSLVLLASLWTFPVPYTMALGCAPFVISVSLLTILTHGSQDRGVLLAFLRVTRGVGIQSSTVVVYAGYNAIFLKLNEPAQLAFVLLLPILKYSFKALVSKLHNRSGDDHLLAVQSSIDIFDALYTTKCMQSTGSILVGLGVIAIDTAINLRSIYKIAQRTDAMRLMFAAGSRSGTIFSGNDSNHADNNHKDNNTSEDQDRTHTLVREAMRLLHECESIAVIEYIETAVPVFYALYISVLFHLPNAQYYQDMRHMPINRLHTVVPNILVYALMELASLVWVHRMLQRIFGISLLRQLAFTLESEWQLFQTYFAACVLITFQFLLMHNGTLRGLCVAGIRLDLPVRVDEERYTSLNIERIRCRRFSIFQPYTGRLLWKCRNHVCSTAAVK